MAKTQEQRKAARAARRAKRKERKKTIDKMISAAKNVPDLSDTDFMNDNKEVFDEIWPALEPALEFAEQLKMTGEKTDIVLNELVNIGNSMADGSASEADISEFQDKLKSIWVKVRMGLSAATVIADDDQDELIDKVISIGDWVTDTDED